MVLDGYQLRSQLGAGRDGIAFRAIAADGATTALVVDLARARADSASLGRVSSAAQACRAARSPSALSVVELDLDQKAPCAVLEWPGEITLATAASPELPATERATAELLRPLAAALAEAHRLGLAHGRVGPEHVFLSPTGGVKLDFTGASAGFPREAIAERAPGRNRMSIDEPGNLAVLRAADLHGLGALIAWLDRKSGAGPRAHAGNMITSEDSQLAGIARALMAEDPAERPAAREVLAVLARLARPMDDTGDWSKPADRSRQEVTLVLPAADRQAIAARTRPRTRAGPETTEYLGRYRLLEKLGEGGQGVVYRAFDPANQSVVAIKVLRSDRASNEVVLRRFRKEARLMIEANNPHVVNLLDQNEHDGIPYLVLEFVAGTSRPAVARAKDAARRTRGPVYHGRRRSWVDAGTRARNRSSRHQAGQHPASRPFCRQRGFPRRDDPGRRTARRNDPGGSTARRPESQLRTNSDALTATLKDCANGHAAGPRVKITDFGLARHVVDSESLAMTDAGALLGTPHYMAPEQWTGRGVDPRTDVYAMGATLYHLLAGQPPFTGETPRPALSAALQRSSAVARPGQLQRERGPGAGRRAGLVQEPGRPIPRRGGDAAGSRSPAAGQAH